MTAADFKDEMARLNGLRFAPADLDTHWEALRDVPLTVLKAAISHAQKTRSDFPTPYELRQDSDQVAHHVAVMEPPREQVRELEAPVEFVIPHVDHPLRVTHDWDYDCETCSDAGMRSFWCGKAPDFPKPDLEVRRCERRGVHSDHEWVERCYCYDTNPTLKRRREAMQRYAVQGAQKKSRD